MDPTKEGEGWTPIMGFSERPGHFLERKVDGLPVWRGARPWESVQGPWRQLGRRRKMTENEVYRVHESC